MRANCFDANDAKQNCATEKNRHRKQKNKVPISQKYSIERSDKI